MNLVSRQQRVVGQLFVDFRQHTISLIFLPFFASFMMATSFWLAEFETVSVEGLVDYE
jgi:hypothetical protein